MILLINSVIAIWQDSNADKALEALKNMQPLKCKVRRNGYWTFEDSKNLVPGDIVEVNMGDSVPADLRIGEMNSVSL
jgi:Ca2+-transporting ATPase